MTPPKTTARFEFDPDTHTYRLDGRKVPGVTDTLKVLDKPALFRWAASQVADYAVDHHDEISAMIDRSPDTAKAFLTETPFSSREKAATRGTGVHKYAEAFMRGQDEVDVPAHDAHLIPYVEAAANFLGDYEVVTIASECPVYSLSPLYAGTLDGIVRLGNSRTVAVIDWKTSKQVWPETAWQLTAYATADRIIIDGKDQPLADFNISKTLVVRLGKDGTYQVCRTRFDVQSINEWETLCKVRDFVKKAKPSSHNPGNIFPPLTGPHQL